MRKWILQRLKNLTHLVREDGTDEDHAKFAGLQYYLADVASPENWSNDYDEKNLTIIAQLRAAFLEPNQISMRFFIHFRSDDSVVQEWNARIRVRRDLVSRTHDNADVIVLWGAVAMQPGSSVLCVLIDHSNPSIVFKIRELCSWIICESAPRHWMRQCVYFHRQFFN